MALKEVNKLDHVKIAELKSTTADSGIVYFYRDRNDATLIHVFDGEEYVETRNFVEIANILADQED
jgi:hypothetical protein